MAIDDCSLDDTWERLRRWAVRDSRIRVLRNERNRGVTGNWIECVRAARADLLLKLDADDVWRPRTLELLAGAFSEEAVVGAGVRALLCTRDLEAYGAMQSDQALLDAGIDPYDDHVLDCARWFAVAARGRMLWPGDGLMVRRRELEAVGGLDARFVSSDSEMQWRLLSRSNRRFAHFAYVGVLYRSVPGSSSREARRTSAAMWEGTVGNLLALCDRGTGRKLPWSLRMRRACLWKMWRELSRRPGGPRDVPESVFASLVDAMRGVVPPPLVERAMWQLQEAVRAAFR